MKRKISLLFILLSFTVIFSLGAVICAEEEAAAPAVSSVTVKNQQKGLYIKWTALKGAEYYKIMRKADNGSYALLTETSANNYLDTTAVSGVNYSYKVLPCKNGAEGICETPGTLTRLDEPEIISVQSGTDGVTVKWKKVDGATKYTVYYKCEGDSSWSHAGFTKDVDSFTHTAAPGGKKCTYTVRARNSSATSSYNTKGLSLDVLLTPQLQKISCVTNGIKISWNKIDGAESYIIYRRGAGEKWYSLTTVPANKSSYTDTTMTPGYTYAYTVRAVNSRTMSSYTSGMPYRYIPVNDISSVKTETDGLKISWKASDYANGYKLYRKAEGESSWKRIAVLSGKNTTSYKDKTVINGKSYTYTLITVRTKYQSTYNSQGKSTVFVATPVATVALKSSNGYKVEWLKIPGATHYYIYRKEKLEDSWVKLGRVNDVSAYTDKTANRNKTYFYCVRAGVDVKYFSAYGVPLKTSDIDPSKKMVALTYDDGPHNTYTNQILDVLEKYDARATFFVVGSRIPGRTQPLTRAYSLGCEIGSHTYNHINLPSYSDSAIINEMNKTDSLVEKYTGERTKIMRPPGGATSSRVQNCLEVPIIMWSVDTRDWEHRTASRTVSHIKNNVYDGAIILMHDLYSSTASATKSIVPWLIDNGYQLVTVSELLYYRGITAKPGVIYRSARP